MISSNLWREVDQVKKEKRHELILSGAEISRRIIECGLDYNIFSLDMLNYLNINQTCLEVIPDEIGKLEKLVTLVLHSNKIRTLPETIGNLKKLKNLDCSQNNLSTLPHELLSLPELISINFGSNSLSELPCQMRNTKLISLDLSNNKFEKFPDICHAELNHLAEVILSDNKIEEIPSSISSLTSLKHLDLKGNSISVIPGELACCQKLKEVNLKDNSLTDKRLFKLVDQCKTRQILEYVRQHCQTAHDDTPNHGKNNRKNRKIPKVLENDMTKLKINNATHRLKISRTAVDTPAIKIMDDVKSIRPHIVACLVKNLTFNEDNFKSFIRLQTKLHEGLCEKRNLATIATHDFDSIIRGDLTYTAMPPRDIKIMPLGRNKLHTAESLFQHLQNEADNLKKEKKRNVYSGIHKYLYLIEGKPAFPCLLDSKNQVISLPPITNSDITKMSVATKNMLVEVTTGISQQVCRKVMDTFLMELVALGVGVPQCSDEGPTLYHDLEVEQMKVVDIEGNLKQIYPSRTDLIVDDKIMTVLRD